MTIAEKLNAWLTPVRRHALYVITVTLAAIVIATTPVLSAQVGIWLQLAIAVGVVGWLILGSIVTRSVTWVAVYRVLGILVAALTAAGWLSGSHADMVMRIGEQFGVIAPMIALLLRTDTSTPTGSPAAEVPTVNVPTVPTVPASGKILADGTMTLTSPDGTVMTLPADGTPPTYTVPSVPTVTSVPADGTVPTAPLS